MDNQEAQIKEQNEIGETPELVEAQGDFLTEQEIAAKMDADVSFFKQVMSGEIDLIKGVRRDGAVAENPGEVATPTDQEQTETETIVPPNDDQGADETGILKVKVDDLKYVAPSGREVKYKSVAQVLKSNKEKEAFIEELLPEREKNKSLEAEVAELRRKLEERNSNNNVQSGNTEGAGEANPDGEVDVFSPEYLKKIGATEAQIKRIEAVVDSLAQEREAEKAAKVRSATVIKVFQSIEEFQEDFPEFKTKTPISQLDEEYKEVIKRIGVLAKTDGSQKANIEAMRLYLEDEGEQGEKLRELAESKGVRLPEEFDTYMEINKLRAEAASKLKTPSLKDAYLLRKAQEGIFTPSTTVNPDASNAAEREKIRKRGQELRDSHATDIPPSMSGDPTEVDAMTVNELERIIDETTDEDLQTNPVALKRYNAVMRRIGGREINPFANR